MTAWTVGYEAHNSRHGLNKRLNMTLPLVRTLFCSRPTLIRGSTFPATWTKCPRPSNWQTWEEERPKGGEGNQCELRNGKWRAQGTNARAQRGTGLPPPPTEERALAPVPPHTRLNTETRIPRHWQFANFFPTFIFCDSGAEGESTVALEQQGSQHPHFVMACPIILEYQMIAVRRHGCYRQFFLPSITLPPSRS